MTAPPQTKPNYTKPYHISSLYLQLSITAILIHNATLPFLEDRDCKPFLGCLFIEDIFFKQHQNKIEIYCLSQQLDLILQFWTT